ncbi:MAG: type IX secretion system sortase PorU [Bacteroidales bacterium]|nr:type IX secretion system sortase PorU [Bacteroidales bacterium]
MNKKLLFLVILALLISTSFAQVKEIKRHVEFEWSARPYCPPEEENMQLLHFFDASYNDRWGNLPLYTTLFSSDISGQNVHFKFTNPVFLPMNMEYLLSEKDLSFIADTVVYEFVSYPELRKSNFQLILIPFRKNPETHILERLFSVDIEVMFSNNHTVSTQQTASYNYPSRSPMADGDWYKIEISETGIYKITGEDLKSMGMNISSINPQKLKMYGLSGSILPYKNEAIPNTGIQELSIFVQGENDGVLNENDYILFYGEGPHVWKYSAENNCFEHLFNIYSDYNYYYVTISNEDGKRIKTVDNNHLQETYTTGNGDFRMFHEQDLEYEKNGGRLWFGERFFPNQEHTFSINIPDFINADPILLKSAVLVNNKVANKSANFIYSNGTETITTFAISTTEPHPKYDLFRNSFNASSGNISLKMKFQSSESAAIGRLDYFELQARQALNFNNKQYGFRDKNSFGEGKITKYQLKNVSSQTIIWDITDHANVYKVGTSTSGSAASFKSDGKKIHEFIAFKDSESYKPVFVGKVENQNILGLRDIESIIVAHPDFIVEAQRLVDEHSNNLGLSTKLLTPQDIYNEFSSGKQDATAIRDVMRMLYLTSGSKPPRYLTLFGLGSYDYKNKVEQLNFVPTWISSVRPKNFFVEISTRASDDYFSMLDEEEGATDYLVEGVPDIAVGRFPVKNIDEAHRTINKRLYYSSADPVLYGAWRNTILLVSDDPDKSTSTSDAFVNSCEGHARIITMLNPNVVIDKVYADSYTRVVAPGGIRYPDANKAINTKMNQGVLIMNYVGHGSPQSLSEERLVEISDINSWNNFNNMPFVITEACTYGPVDFKETSAGETMFLKENGGAIALLVSQRPSTNTANNSLIREFYKALLPSDSNQHQPTSIGTAAMLAKREVPFDNSYMYSIFGDPAMYLAFPSKYEVFCTEINGKDVLYNTDTISALTSVKLSGEIHNIKGEFQNGFNGKVYPTIYDKEVVMKTLGQVSSETITEYYMWKNIIFKGIEKVENGRFTFEFFVSKDIDYSFDYSRISFYAYDEKRMEDANGMFNKFVVGGINPNPDIDETPPSMQLYMNDTLFVNGGYTDSNPILLVKLYDENGINATGSAIGHDIIGVLDGNVNNQFSLNNFYQATSGYKQGDAFYPLYNLSEGEHTITVRAWDTYNNSTTGTIKFVVVTKPKLIVEDLYNYPNPFNSYTDFIFSHNVSNEQLEVTLKIYDITGRFIREIQHTDFSTGYRIPPIRWYGDYENGSPASSGCYIYQVIVKNSSGSTVKKAGKAFIAR